MTQNTYNEHIVNSKYVLFLGAGASVPFGLYPTGPFLTYLSKELPQRVSSKEQKNLPDLGALFSLAARFHNINPPDSEVVLDYLQFLIRTCRDLQRLQKGFANLAGTAGMENFHQSWSNAFQRVLEYMHELVVEHYSRVDGGRARTIYKPLLKTLNSSSNTIPIFTTNYDWVFENLAAGAEAEIRLVDGFRLDSLGGRWDENVFANFCPDAERTNLTLFKLHGSTSWYTDRKRDNEIRKVPIPAPNLAGSQAVLIYPTQVKTDAVKEEPFKTAYSYLSECLNHARLCIAIGSSFRDPAINAVFHKALEVNSELRLLVIDPGINKSGGLEWKSFLGRIGHDSEEWKGRIHAIIAPFGEGQQINGWMSESITGLDKWNELNHWRTQR
ncbi:MAG: hypothetical protein FJ317_04485 [SAR202 cluster bacterium]|nr:hypothetical protein [SAR202 cluster bacterium]